MSAADPRAFLRSLFDAAVAAAQPARVLAAHLPRPPAGRTVVVGAGKASAAMAAAVEAHWPREAPLSGLVVVPYRHVPPGGAQRIEVIEAAHPVPDDAGQRAAQRILSQVHGLGEDDLVLCLISGGGSSLLALPATGLTLADKQRVHRALLHSGATITEMNCVRKHLSAIKGGRLALQCGAAQVRTLVISDVPGDDVSVIASGPTVADATTCADALAVIERYRVDLPAAVLEALRRGELETPKPGDPRLAQHVIELIAAPRASLQAAAAVVRAAGLPVHVLSDEIEGESRDVGQVHAALARAVARRGEPFAKPCVILSGGETTVTLPSGSTPGRGGRATEFLLGCAIALQGEGGVWGLAADTDGIDGIGPNAGALLTPDTLARAVKAGLNARQHLDAHDAASFFEPLGDLLQTGPTFTNVNDFRALLVM